MKFQGLWGAIMGILLSKRQPRSLPAIEVNLSYGNDPAHKFDIYRCGVPNAPTILMIHGGGWRNGDKAYPNVVDNKIAYWVPKGYNLISGNYRMGEEITPIDQVNDVAKLLAYCQSNGRALGVSPNKFILMGHSAGAHLVVLLSSDPSIGEANNTRDILGTVSLDSAAYNVIDIMNRPHLALYDQAFGTDEDLWAEASPTLQLQEAPKPVFLVTSSESGGESDRYENVQEYYDRVIELGGEATILPVTMTHSEINAKLGIPGEYTDKVDAFLTHLTRI